ncbi:hypothetical protein A3J90_03210 [candidate division WOR-1 bacterium RIFOXYC2_FULL_37_10]|uniref:Uncharacterized protein n=1 Tax=candidate division WOR-1 bacterium RIFOXYB2_FULL_37_13 TaxID=1802579 RepID=A0A1F4SDZ7_UNCSA|nr:MAG: hypothetical protein A2310_03580 [candidate division WOR-1 bacterium RIFOXYB2_FULL_37_13]OGC36841.1 MAG: hypothetical protein A3J90_03210 [candidate division WOR-1 bacterium RIFOXYC2_FULL_37_10]
MWNFFLKLKNINEARIAFQEATNYYWISIIYLSEEISQTSKTFIDKMEHLLSNYETPDNTAEFSAECKKLKEDITKLVKEIISLMKKELTLMGNNPE